MAKPQAKGRRQVVPCHLAAHLLPPHVPSHAELPGTWFVTGGRSGGGGGGGVTLRLIVVYIGAPKIRSALDSPCNSLGGGGVKHDWIRDRGCRWPKH